MRKILLGLTAGAAMLAGTAAFADEFVATTDASPYVHQARLVCDSFGNCYRTPSRRVIIGDSYAYTPGPYYYGDPYYYGPRVGVGVWGGPSVGFSFGVGPRHWW